MHGCEFSKGTCFYKITDSRAFKIRGLLLVEGKDLRTACHCRSRDLNKHLASIPPEVQLGRDGMTDGVLYI